LYSQYAVNRPHATQANINAADPNMRIVRTFGINTGNTAKDIFILISAGGEPMATMALLNVD
jgi:hypothetical protein